MASRKMIKNAFIITENFKDKFCSFLCIKQASNKFPNGINNHNDKQECKFKRSDIIYEIFSKLGVNIRSESS